MLQLDKVLSKRPTLLMKDDFAGQGWTLHNDLCTPCRSLPNVLSTVECTQGVYTLYTPGETVHTLYSMLKCRYTGHPVRVAAAGTPVDARHPVCELS